MPDETILYGNIIGEDKRREMQSKHPDSSHTLLWQDRPEIHGNPEQLSLVFVDLDNPTFSASEFLISIATSARNLKVIGKLDDPTPEETLRVAKLGVSEILNPDNCLQRLDDILNELESAPAPEPTKSSQFNFDALMGCSATMTQIRKTIMHLADVDYPSALLLGETGTGKGLVSRIMHHTGLRAENNLVEVNCSAIPDDLFESELFGHVKGAFTDAKNEKLGLFEYAQGGTIFLDEVGNLSASAQAKLLKILEDKKLRKVGDVSERDTNVRVLAATNLDLDETIKDGQFRDDLFFRLNLLTIEIPPLRSRPEDIPVVIDHYLGFYATLYGKPGIKIEAAAVEEMSSYHWPGNVRELCNVIERAVLLATTKSIKIKDIKGAFRRRKVSAADCRKIVIDVPGQGMSLEAIESQAVKHVLDMCNWNKSKAAKFLKISRPRLRRILDSSGLEQNRRQD